MRLVYPVRVDDSTTPARTPGLFLKQAPKVLCGLFHVFPSRSLSARKAESNNHVPQQTPTDMVHVYLSTAMTKYLTGSNLRAERFVLSYSQGNAVPHSREGLRQSITLSLP